ncbi:hypothetical protein BJ508DRAFT_40684 [Ascobolus immersus RN42]|uniref:Uncharacterized protein n=1 Tax=Ascobolus immersus RN42 TaxID=1160509 RepID=A0A3N4HJE9_ASCIM|nr:hypothetical protein BJ508DRAFT_40684 [Ascobolus immersus RN42]
MGRRFTLVNASEDDKFQHVSHFHGFGPGNTTATPSAAIRLEMTRRLQLDPTRAPNDVQREIEEEITGVPESDEFPRNEPANVGDPPIALIRLAILVSLCRNSKGPELLRSLRHVSNYSTDDAWEHQLDPVSVPLPVYPPPNIPNAPSIRRIIAHDFSNGAKRYEVEWVGTVRTHRVGHDYLRQNYLRDLARYYVVAGLEIPRYMAAAAEEEKHMLEDRESWLAKLSNAGRALDGREFQRLAVDFNIEYRNWA